MVGSRVKKEGTAIFLFRRDLRLYDNTGLIAALENHEKVIPIFILDEYLLNNPNLSLNATQFMRESLYDLANQLIAQKGKLVIFKGKPAQIIKKILNNPQLKVSSLIYNRDYTPYALNRDSKVVQLCKRHKIDVIQYSDLLLNEPESVVKTDGKFYTVFTPYYRNASQIPVKKPIDNKYSNYYIEPIENDLSCVIDKELNFYNNSIEIKGGRKKALNILQNIQKFQNYSAERDFPAIQGTTRLSAHLKFGTVSIREVYHVIRKESIESLLRQLYWREFYVNIGYHFPHVFKNAFKQKYNNLDWSYDKEAFISWCEGNTGFPIVDAGMRELNQTGYMHTRIRMIVASFLTKDLLIDWKWGEKYFAKKLIDFDISINNGNWQWASSTGTDAQPYFRIFNPWIQQKKFDKNCIYIKKYVPELAHLTTKEIHNLDKNRPSSLVNYPKPIVNHKKIRNAAIAMFKAL